MDMVRERELNVPIFQKQNLTIEEAAVYSNIGQHKRENSRQTNAVRSFCGWEIKGFSSAGSLTKTHKTAL